MLDLKHRKSHCKYILLLSFTQEKHIVISQSSVATESLMKTHVSYIPIP